MKVVMFLPVLCLCIVPGAVAKTNEEFVPWPKRVESVRLTPERPILRDDDVTEDNAFYYIRQLPTVFDSTPLPEGNKWGAEWYTFRQMGLAGGPYPDMDEAVEILQPAFDLARKAENCSGCQVITVLGFDFLLPYLSPVRGTVQLLCYKAMRLAEEGLWDDAIDALNTAMSLSVNVQQGGVLINHLVGLAACSSVSETVRRISEDFALPKDVQNRFIELLAWAENSLQAPSETMRYEYLPIPRAVEMLYKNPGLLNGEDELKNPTAWFYGRILLSIGNSTPETTKEHFAAVYSNLIYALELPLPQSRRYLSDLFEDIEGIFNQRMVAMFDDPLGRLLVALMVPAMDRFYERHLEVICELRGSQLVLAARVYRVENGRFPETMEQLAIAGSIEDPFSTDGKPFQMVSADGGLTIYSVGIDQKDDAGLKSYHREKRLGLITDASDICFSLDEFEVRRKDHQEACKNTD
jgi:hypothetical protein